DSRQAPDAGEHLGCVGQLRHPFGADEAGGLDAAQAGGREPVDQLDLVGSGNELLLVLQAIARADLDDADEVVHAYTVQRAGRGKRESMVQSFRAQCGARFSRNADRPSRPSSEARSAAISAALARSSASRSPPAAQTSRTSTLADALATGPALRSSSSCACTASSSAAAGTR